MLPRLMVAFVWLALASTHAQVPVTTAPSAAGATADTRSSSARSPRNASYRISARLDPATRTITGSETITGSARYSNYRRFETEARIK